jgi:hypothetical protein
MAAETKHVIVLEINEEHHIQIENTYYSCIYEGRPESNATHLFSWPSFVG